MENATKALLIAGEVLLGVLIASFLVYVFASNTNLSNEYSSIKASEDLAMINYKFEKYNRDDLSIHDIISAVNLAKNYKEEYGEVIIKLSNPVGLHGTLSSIAENDLEDKLIKAIMADAKEKSSTDSIRYKCTKIEYKDGKIIRLEFEKK